MSQFFWSPGTTLKVVEEQFVVEAMKFYNNKQSAANSLGITLDKLEEIVKRSQLAKEEQLKQDEKHRKERELFVARSRGVATFDPKTGADIISPYVQSEGLDALQAATVLANTAEPGSTTSAASGDPLAAAKKTKKLMEQAEKNS